VAVRVRLKLRRGDRVLETPALANTGYEAETPQILVPKLVAEILGYWPPPVEAETVFETAGGPLRVWVIPRACSARVVAEGAESPEVVVDLVISPTAGEVLLSDKAISELQIAIEDAGRGLWRFRWEPREVLRSSVPPKIWK